MSLGFDGLLLRFLLLTFLLLKLLASLAKHVEALA